MATCEGSVFERNIVEGTILSQLIFLITIEVGIVVSQQSTPRTDDLYDLFPPQDLDISGQIYS